MHADIAERQSAQHRIRDGMKQHVGIGMPGQAEIGRNRELRRESAGGLASIRCVSQPCPMRKGESGHLHHSGDLKRRGGIFERQIQAGELHVSGLGDFDIAIGTEDNRYFHLFESLNKRGFVRANEEVFAGFFEGLA